MRAERNNFNFKTCMQTRDASVRQPVACQPRRRARMHTRVLSLVVAVFTMAAATSLEALPELLRNCCRNTLKSR